MRLNLICIFLTTVIGFSARASELAPLRDLQLTSPEASEIFQPLDPDFVADLQGSAETVTTRLQLDLRDEGILVPDGFTQALSNFYLFAHLLLSGTDLEQRQLRLPFVIRSFQKVDDLIRSMDVKATIKRRILGVSLLLAPILDEDPKGYILLLQNLRPVVEGQDKQYQVQQLKGLDIAAINYAAPTSIIALTIASIDFVLGGLLLPPGSLKAFLGGFSPLEMSALLGGLGIGTAWLLTAHIRFLERGYYNRHLEDVQDNAKYRELLFMPVLNDSVHACSAVFQSEGETIESSPTKNVR